MDVGVAAQQKEAHSARYTGSYSRNHRMNGYGSCDVATPVRGRRPGMLLWLPVRPIDYLLAG